MSFPKTRGHGEPLPLSLAIKGSGGGRARFPLGVHAKLVRWVRCHKEKILFFFFFRKRRFGVLQPQGGVWLLLAPL